MLAAGQSRRAGVFKPAYRLDGKPLVAHAVDSLRPWCGRVIVVAGHRHAEVAALVARQERVVVVVNADHAEGMFTSVQAGVRAVDPGCEGFFVLPVDCPRVGSAVVGELIDVFRRDLGLRAVVPVHAGRGGHPVLLPPSARQAILAAPRTATLREVIATVGAVRCAVADPGVVVDLDTPADLRALGPTDAETSTEE